MFKNLAHLAHAALTARTAPDAASATAALPSALDGRHNAVLGDTHLLGKLGFALLLHRRDDGLVAEELYCAYRLGSGWTDADHLSGGLLGIELTDPAEVTRALGGRPMVLFSESSSSLPTGRPEAGGGEEFITVYEYLVDKRADHLAIENTTPGTDRSRAPTLKPLTSQTAAIAVHPGEQITVTAMERNGDSKRPMGDPDVLTGRDGGPTYDEDDTPW